jgi:hypothetical protein
MAKGPPSIKKSRPPARRDEVDARFDRSMWWRNVMMGSLLGLIAAVALLATGIANPLRQGIGVVAVILAFCFSASFVMTALTAAQLRHLVARKNRGIPKAPRSISKRDLIVYLIAFGSATLVGIGYVLSFREISWAWPAFVTITFLVVGVILLLRRQA